MSLSRRISEARYREIMPLGRSIRTALERHSAPLASMRANSARACSFAIDPVRCWTRPSTSGKIAACLQGASVADQPFDHTRYEAELEAELERITNPFGDYNVPDPTMLHYCPLNAAYGILGDDRIWFTERANLTDPSEIAFALNIALRLYEKRRGNNDMVRALTRMFKTSLHEILTQNDVFVCCFSMARDSLPQWRMYADDGRGAALEFDGRMMAARSREEPGIVDNSYRMQYDVRHLIRHLRAIGEVPTAVLLKQPSKIADTDREEIVKLTHAVLGTHIIVAANQYKHRAYDYEKEWRLMAMAHSAKVQKMDRHRTRERGPETVRYITQETDPGIRKALRAVRIGPAADGIRVGEVKDFLARIGLGNIPVIKSTIPYRSVL